MITKITFSVLINNYSSEMMLNNRQLIGCVIIKWTQDVFAKTITFFPRMVIKQPVTSFLTFTQTVLDIH